MEKDFTHLRKQMPYRVPEGFFAQNEQAILQQLPARQAPLVRLWPWVAAAAAAVVVAIAVWQLPRTSEIEGVLYADNDFLTVDELALWDEFYEADLFLSYDTSEE